MKRFLGIMVVSFAAGLWVQGCGNVQEKEVGFKVVQEEQPSPEATPPPAEAKSREAFKRFRVYSDGNSPDNHFFPSGWMGDHGDLSIDQASFDSPHSGTTCFKVAYSAKASQGANWAGIYWQNPPNNWGAKKGGYDLTGARRFVFWARGAKGGERVEEFRVGGMPGEFADSDIAAIGPVLLTPEWKQYTIDVSDKDLTSIIGGFMYSANVDQNPNGFVIYLDDMYYE